MPKAMKWPPSLLFVAALAMLAVAPAAHAQLIIDPDTVECVPAEDCLEIWVGFTFQAGMTVWGEIEYVGGPDTGLYAEASTYISANNCSVEILAESTGGEGEDEYGYDAVISTSQGGYPPPLPWPAALASESTDVYGNVDNEGGGSYPC